MDIPSKTGTHDCETKFGHCYHIDTAAAYMMAIQRIYNYNQESCEKDAQVQAETTGTTTGSQVPRVPQVLLTAVRSQVELAG